MSLLKFLKQVLWVLFLTVLLLGVPRLAGAFADLFDYSTIDPDGAFAWISVHHIAQAVVFLMLMLAISKVSAIRFGFGWGDRKEGLAYLRLFVLIYIGYVVVHRLIFLLLAGSLPVFWYQLTARNIIGQLSFQLLLTGPSEELIFRVFAITMLGLLVKGAVSDGEKGPGKVIATMFGGKISVANLIAAVIFGLAHVRFTFAPFSASFETGQVVVAVILGLFYGVCYERSKSMIYPMMMHSFSNVIVVGVSIITGFIIG
ncbi:MAG: CPBP family intramembrane metalloprotease [Anaerolineae bacterium]|nr:CPBP family intramembrane metalloprotease [Anaerolineae bacterium]